jgi:hypothetical protein
VLAHLGLSLGGDLETSVLKRRRNDTPVERASAARMSGSPNGARRAPTRHVQALENRMQGETAALTLTTLRFLTHPAFPALFPRYLIGLYHSMRTAGAVMEAARARSVSLARDCPVAARLVPYWTRHIREEAGHDEWLLADLARLGADPERVRVSIPAPEIAELMGTLHFWIQHAHPVAALAYFYVVERNPPTVELLDWIVQSGGIPREALQTFYQHASIDIGHARELEDLIDSLPLAPAHLDLMVVSATTVVRQLSRIYEELIGGSDTRRQERRRAITRK